MKLTRIFLATSLAMFAIAEPAFAQSQVKVDFDGGAELSDQDIAAVSKVAECIVAERRGMAKRYLKKQGDERLRLLLPMISAPCQPEDGARLNVPLLEAKLQELLNA